MSDAFEAEIVITRRPAPFIAKFECVSCDRAAMGDPWAAESRRPVPPICRSCEATWGALKLRPAGITRGDYRTLQRLSAMISRLQWEAMNGRRPS